MLDKLSAQKSSQSGLSCVRRGFQIGKNGRKCVLRAVTFLFHGSLSGLWTLLPRQASGRGYGVMPGT